MSIHTTIAISLNGVDISWYVMKYPLVQITHYLLLIITFFGLRSGQDLKNRAAHSHQEFPGVPSPPVFSTMVDLPFRRHPRDQGKCPMNRDVPWIESWALVMINQQRKYLLCYSTSKLVPVILSSGSIMYENLSPRCCALNSHKCNTPIWVK